MKAWTTKREFAPYQVRIKIESPEDEEALWDIAEDYDRYSISSKQRGLLITISNCLGEVKYKDG